MSLTRLGVLVSGAGTGPSTSGSTGRRRGAIEGFSADSCRRMRRWLIGMEVPLPPGSGGLRAVTLTIPGEVTPDEWRTALRRWSKIVQRAGCGAVWRVELQKRGQPHLHVVLWNPNPHWVPEGFLCYTWSAWSRCLPERCRSHPHAARRAVLSEPIDVEEGEGDEAWFRYVVAHATKHKSSQLGWKGKQWGIINRSLFRPRQGEVVSLTDGELDQLARWLRRYLRSKAKPQNRRRIRVGRRGWSRFVAGGTVRRMCLELVRVRHAKDDGGLRGTYLSRLPVPLEVARPSRP